MISLERAREFSAFNDVAGFALACDAWGISHESGRRYLRRARQLSSAVDKIHATYTEANCLHTLASKSEVVGVIGDTHEPFCHKDYLGFVSKQFEKHGVTKVVHIGDLVDNHAISRHISEPNAMGAELEYERTLEGVARWAARFPDATLIQGNHDMIPMRQAKELGIPEQYVKDLTELWNLPKSWTVVDEIIIDDVYYKHGVGNSGVHPAYNLCKDMAMSSVMGHVHSAGGVKYRCSPNKLWFGLDVGCGINIKAYAFRYAKPFSRRPVLGCGIVHNCEYAQFIPMKL